MTLEAKLWLFGINSVKTGQVSQWSAQCVPYPAAVPFLPQVSLN